MSDTAAVSRLPDLIALAEEGSSEKRRALLRELTEHFFGSPARTATEDDLYGAVLAKLTRRRWSHAKCAAHRAEWPIGTAGCR